MEKQYLDYLSGFIHKAKRERLIYELQSKKRENAFSKMTHFENIFDERNVVEDLSSLDDAQAVERVRKIVGDTTCYNVRTEEMMPVEKAYIQAVNSCLCNILVVDKTVVIYVGECEVGASTKYILKRVNKV